MSEDSPREVWRAIPGYEGWYEASDLGRVRSVDRVVIGSDGRFRRWRGVLLSPSKRPDGRLKVSLSRGGTQETWNVHRLVALTFLGPRPDGLHTCHNDGDETNNRLTNLRYDTVSENAFDRVRHGTHHHVVKTHCPQGHPLVGANLKTAALRLRNNRLCRACGLAHSKISYLRKKRRPLPDLKTLADQIYADLVSKQAA